MSEDQSASDKTEEPTSHRLSKAREKGQVIKSQEVNSSVVLIAGALGLLAFGSFIWDRLTRVFYHVIWRETEFRLDDIHIEPLMALLAQEFVLMALPMALLIMIVGVVANILQTGGFLFSTDNLMPKFSKINPFSGLKRMFSVRSVVECIKSQFKIGIIGGISYLVIKKHMDDFVVMGDMEPAQIGLLTLWISFELFIKVCLFLGIMAIFDYGYQRWQFMKDMRMTKQEIKDEYKQLEGDPIIKSRIRQAQREAAKKRMLADVPKADVVITNPTHLAIAMMYNPAVSPAPVVVAKGQNFMAQRIKDIAKENKVPIMENKPLARALYQAVEIGQSIPVEFYKAVAEVLSYVYRLKGKRPNGGKPGR